MVLVRRYKLSDLTEKIQPLISYIGIKENNFFFPLRFWLLFKVFIIVLPSSKIMTYYIFVDTVYFIICFT